MNTERNLVLIKGEDKTDQINTWRYHDGRICIKFNNGKTYNYAVYNVEFYKDPLELNSPNYIALYRNQPLSNVNIIQRFEKHFRIIYNYLYKSYSEKRVQLLKKLKRVSEYDSENLMYAIIKKIINQESFKQLDVVMHVPLKMIIRDPKKLDEKETAFAMNVLTHTDFLLFDKLNRRPILVVEVDGYAFHVDNARQIERDKMKDAVLMKYQIPVLRFRTNESDEEKRLVKELREILHSTRAGKGRMINEELQRQTPDS